MIGGCQGKDSRGGNHKHVTCIPQLKAATYLTSPFQCIFSPLSIISFSLSLPSCSFYRKKKIGRRDNDITKDINVQINSVFSGECCHHHQDCRAETSRVMH